MVTQKKIILIIGFMGSGKSTLLKEFLIRGEVQEAYDLDEEVSKTQNLSIADYIEQKGMESFRLAEAECLEILLDKIHDGQGLKVALSLGGGTLEGTKSYDLLLLHHPMAPFIEVHYLPTPFEECWKRISENSEEFLKRPLARQGRTGMEALYNKRTQLYECFVKEMHRGFDEN